MGADNFEIVMLGTGAAFAPLDRENTSLALVWEEGVWLIDCGASPHKRLVQAGIDPQDLRGILITHHHPDHLYGLPSLIHCLIPTPREEPLLLLAPPEAMNCARQVLKAFEMLERPEVPLETVEIPMHRDSVNQLEEVYRSTGLRLWTAPVAHTLECAGVRAEAGGRTAAYSADSAPCDAIRRLAAGADLLVHEAIFREEDRPRMPAGHSTALDAGRTASDAGVDTLILVHFLEATLSDPAALIAEAAGAFTGRIEIGKELERYRV
jgi:ribonuclease Z